MCTHKVKKKWQHFVAVDLKQTHFEQYLPTGNCLFKDEN